VYAGADGRWMLIDDRATLEAYPLFPDVPAAPGLEVGPRVIDLRRSEDGLTGHVRRRYMRGSAVCTAKVPVRVTSCGGDALQLVLADTAPPLTWPADAEQPCGWPRPAPSRVERWIRE
jgi:hypothetical protein